MIARLVQLNAVALALALAAVVLTSSAPTPLCVLDNNCDALVFRSVAEALHAGRMPYAPWEFGGLTLHFAYPPWALPLFALYAHGRLAMLALGALGASGLALLARREHGDLFGLLALGGGWTFFSLWLGQTGLLMGIAGFLLLRHRAGLGLLLLVLKPQFAPLVLVALIRKRRGRDLAFAALGVAILSATATIWLGPQVWSTWVEALLRAPPELDRSFMSSWQAWAPPLPWWAGAVPLALGCVAVAVVRADGRTRIALALVLATIVAPHAHPYDLALWVPAAACTRRPVVDLSVLALTSHVAILSGTRALLPLVALWLVWRLLEARDPEES
ncbi:MAG: hypothetical protein GY913_09785 [Proteobacteria bacterium]|nr:hypothetical protein [Pseudomonadota bacterium]MCP4917202.1 hypothetical protein [Pseudomonadota bacterium]